MGRKIILLSDGTGNSSAKVWRTNVWRTFEALDLSGNDQVALYDDGVGTSSFKPMAILGGAFGLGLRRNVIALYKFACRNYRDTDDELFGFGFSRGAFTIRIVMGLIDSQGLVKADSEAELHSLASAAYRAYRRDRYHNLKFEAPYQWIRNKFGPHYPPAEVRKNVKIRFVGVWDTVAAYGMPVYEMTRGIHQYLWPIELPNNHLSASIVRACQALALDEERTTFHPQLWDETGGTGIHADAGEPDPTGPRFIKDERISQVWFAGVHTNVGGGYPDDSLAYIPFVWMITEAKRCGLKFKSDYANLPADADVMRADPDTFKNAVSKRDKDGRLYDPRKGLGGYYRYGPRKLVPHFYRESHKLEEDEVEVERAKIHESVFRRIQNHAQAYAPVGLPPYYDVVKENGEIVSPDAFQIAPASRPLETRDAAAQRALAQEHVWNWVWARRILYFATVGATLWLVMFPLLSSAQKVDELTSPFRMVSDFVRFVGSFLPDFASTWTDGYARAPVWFMVMAGLVTGLLYLSSKIASRTSNVMASIWQNTAHAPKGLPDNFVYRLRSNRFYIGFHEGLKKNIAPAFFAVMFVYLAAGLVSHLSFDILDVAGATCEGSKPPLVELKEPAHKSETTKSDPVDFGPSDLCVATGIMLTRGAHYRATIVPVEPVQAWSNGLTHYDFPIGGFPTIAPPPWYIRLYYSLFLPFRREFNHDWFRIVLRFGEVGGEETFYDPDPTDPVIEFPFRPTRDGELFVFVNDAVIGIPGLYRTFYRNNTGTARLTIERLKIR
jgi:uncharacterized protein (DUF2235 family)